MLFDLLIMDMQMCCDYDYLESYVEALERELETAQVQYHQHAMSQQQHQHQMGYCDDDMYGPHIVFPSEDIQMACVRLQQEILEKQERLYQAKTALSRKRKSADSDCDTEYSFGRVSKRPSVESQEEA